MVTAQQKTRAATRPLTPQSEEEQVVQITADIEAALADIDPENTKALYARCSQILDDIHSGRF